MRFSKALKLPVYVYSDDELALRDIGIDPEPFDPSSDQIEDKYYFSVDIVSAYREYPDSVSIVQSQDDIVFVAMPVLDLVAKIERHITLNQ